MLSCVPPPALRSPADELLISRLYGAAGFTLTWLILGVLFFPFVWIIARIFITRSMILEESEVEYAAIGNQKRNA